MCRFSSQTGFTLIEVVITAAIAVILIAAMSGIIDHTLKANYSVQTKNETVLTAHLAMQRMVTTVATSRNLLLPLDDNPATSFREHVREETVPASAPESGSIKATAVLAVTLPATFDLDGNGIPDADNDQDGRIDEDLPGDSTNDGEPGVRGFDDDGNGTADFFLSPSRDDDESNNLAQNEDPINGVDDDGDGSIDEDPGEDSNNDGAPGIVNIDDDGDGNIDEGNVADDDEDGSDNEDWFDPIVYYLNNGALVERIAVPWDTDSSGDVDGRDFVESTLAENITLLRFERVPLATGERAQLVDITLEISPPDGEPFQLNTTVRLGGAL